MKKYLTLENLGIAAGALALSALIWYLALFLVDCAQGTDVDTKAYIYDRSFREAYWERHYVAESYTDRRGNRRTRRTRVSTWHPPEYHLYIRDMTGSRFLSVTPELYYHYRTGDMVPIRKRIGKKCGCTCWESVL
ncbi:hypothetical protein [Arsenicibacter rosenii]|uniref:Uncharacterized protein n=1 Tax=Arsenicibacter rosenii TaxID=1750698 RepID=A0A1S2VDJ0_9BACT|nr:hypothetical protein [Arsenicibacter rosenii]OIN56773.1 hypothetical protein BLX24_22620 [Arsenicibacter rosenii]